jgi:hypothetical protein
MANQQGQPDCQENAQESAHQKHPNRQMETDANIEANDHNAQQVVIMITVPGDPSLCPLRAKAALTKQHEAFAVQSRMRHVRKVSKPEVQR